MNNKTLSDLMLGRNNNFDFIRFLAATMVILTHAFTLGKGDLKYTGHAALVIFFVTSGFLITQSYENSKSLRKFIKARVLRVYPALVLVTLFTLFVIGPLATTVTLNEYFTSSQTWFYLTRMTAFVPDLHLIGVFQNSVEPYANAINTPLWTIKYEIICYCLVAVLGIIGCLKKKVLVTLFIVNLIFHLFPQNHLGKAINDIADLSYMFQAGMLFYTFKNQIKHTLYFLIPSIIMVIVSIYLGYIKEVLPLAGGYILLYVAFSQRIRLHNFAKYGDFSYGLYIFAFPIQQLLVYYFHNSMSPLQNFFYTFPLALVMAAISWHFVEKPCLKLKNTKINYPLWNMGRSNNDLKKSG